MNDEVKKQVPPYTTYTQFFNLIIDLREHGIPEHVTRSVAKGSNSAKSMMLAALKSMKLITEHGEPTEELRRIVEDEEGYVANLQKTMFDTYPFLFDGSIDLANTTTEKVEEKFRGAGASGSTITKCVAFFLAAAKDAEIPVSPRVKAPSPSRGSSPARRKAANGRKKPENEEPPADNGNEPDIRDQDYAPEGMERITVPLRNMVDGVIFFPEGLSPDEARRAVRAAVFNLKHYYELDEED